MGVCLPSRARVLGGTRSLSWARITVPSVRVLCGLWCIVSFYQRLGFQSADASVHPQ